MSHLQIRYGGLLLNNDLINSVHFVQVHLSLKVLVKCKKVRSKIMNLPLVKVRS